MSLCGAYTMSTSASSGISSVFSRLSSSSVMFSLSRLSAKVAGSSLSPWPVRV